MTLLKTRHWSGKASGADFWTEQRYLSIVLTVRTTAPFVSSVGHVTEIAEKIFGRSKANCLSLMLFTKI